VAGRLGEAVATARAAGRRMAVATDENVRSAAPGLFAGPLAEVPAIVVPPGEGSKCLGELGRVCEFLAAQNIDRGGVVIAVGGGVVGDLAGFAAAAFLRGIDYWQVPTTLLAMVDSAVGGKTAVNLQAGKNLVGAFHQPRAVYCDMALLATLPAREFAAGMAEVIKYGLLGDAPLFQHLEEGRPLVSADARLAGVVRRCCAIKASVVQADERETAPSGGRALLNLGHTFAHAIEAVAGYGEYLHGEAVGIGLVAAARLSEVLGLIGPGEVERVRAIIAVNGLPVRLRAPLARVRLLDAMGRDKKIRHGRLRFVVLEALGLAATRDGVDPAQAERIWSELGAE
jgi:3-dehydroquinate synthase